MLRGHAPARPLIGVGRIREAVAKHPAAGAQGRLDVIREMHRASRKHQQQLGRRRQRFVRAAVSTRSRICSASGVPPGSRVTTCAMPALGKGLREPCNLSGLADALDSLDGEETAPSAHGSAPPPCWRMPREVLRHGGVVLFQGG